MSSPSPSSCSSSSSLDSLFSDRDRDRDRDDTATSQVARRTCPPIPGLWIFPSLLSDEVARNALHAIGDDNLFSGGNRDQVMLFEAPDSTSTDSNIPRYLKSLLSCLEEILRPHLPKETLVVLFHQRLARQVILNLYLPGQGISSHIDLPNRYADGILGCSLTGGCVMRLSKHSSGELHQVYMPSRTVYYLTDEARWDWAHGIDERLEDVVESPQEKGKTETIIRDIRVSVTFRWMKEGADVLQ